MAEPKKITPGKILVIGAAAIILYGIFAGVRANASIFSVYMADIAGVSYGEANIVFSLVQIILGISGPVFGYLTIKTSSRTIIFSGAVLTTIGLAGTALSTSLAGFIIFTGIIFALGSSALGYSILYAASVPLIGESRGAVFSGILTAAEGIFSMAETPALEWLAADFSFQTCMLIFAALSLVTIPLAFLFRRKSDADTAEAAEAKSASVPGIIKELVKSPFFYILALIFLVNGFCCGSMSNHLYMFCLDIGMAQDATTLKFLIYSFAFIIGSLIGGFAAGKIKNKYILLGSTFVIWGVSMIVSDIIDPMIALVPVTFLLGSMAAAALPIYTVILQEKISILKFAATFTVLDIMYRIGYSVDAVYEGFLYDWLGDFNFADFSIAGLAIACAVVCIICGLRAAKKSKD